MIRPILIFILITLALGFGAKQLKRLTPNQREMLSTGAVFWFIIALLAAAFTAVIVFAF